MAEERTYQGHVYRRNSANEPWVIAGPAPTGGGTIIVDQYKQSAERRADEDQVMQREAAARSAAAADRQAAAAERQAGAQELTASNTGFNQTLKLRSDFDSMPGVKEYRVALPQLTQGLRTAPDAAGDNALIYAYAKAMDPGSVVRESEMQMASGAGSWLESAAANLKKQFGIEGGGQLSPDVRAKLRREMLGKVTELNRAYNVQRRRYETDARALGVDPERVIGVHDGQAFLPEIQRELQEDPRVIGNLVGDDAPAPAGDSVQYVQPTPDDGGLTGSVTDDSPNYQTSLLGQGMSGINSGLAGAAGLPVDLATMGLNLIPKGLNAVANTNLPTIEQPFMGSDWLKDKMAGWGIYDPNADGSGSFVRRVGESVGSALIPGGMASNTPRQMVAALLAGTSGGIGAATAQQVAPGNVGAEIAGELLGGGVAGAGLAGLGRRQAQREIESTIPTVPELKERAGRLYDAAEASGVTADPPLTQQLADDIRKVLIDDGRISPAGRINETYPKAKEAVQLIDDYAGSTMTPRQMQTVRSVMAESGPDAAERRVARLLMNTFDDWAAPLAPELADARAVSKRYLEAQTLEDARDMAGKTESSFTGSGLENALRQQYRSLDKAVTTGRENFSEPVRQQIGVVNRGTPTGNVARVLGKLAPNNSLVSLAGGFGGYSAGGLPGAIALPALGAASRKVATDITSRNAEVAELLARNGGAIEQAPLVSPATEKLIAAILASQTSQYMPEIQ